MPRKKMRHTLSLNPDNEPYRGGSQNWRSTFHDMQFKKNCWAKGATPLATSCRHGQNCHRKRPDGGNLHVAAIHVNRLRHRLEYTRTAINARTPSARAGFAGGRSDRCGHANL